MLKVYTGFFKKIINTLFFNQTFVTQNEHPVTDASRTPRGCGFDVLKSQKGWQLVIKVNWKFLRFSIAIGHLFTEVANQLALFLESHQFLLVFLTNIFAALGVVGWNKKTKCLDFALAVHGLQKSIDITVWKAEVYDLNVSLTSCSLHATCFEQERGNSFSPPPSPPPVFCSGFTWLERTPRGLGEQGDMIYILGNKGYFWN